MSKELTRTEAAKYLGVSPRTLDYWATKRTGPDYRKRGRNTFYRIPDLDRWSDKHQLRHMPNNQPPCRGTAPFILFPADLKV